MGIYIVSIFFPIVNNAGVNIFAFLVRYQRLWVSSFARFCRFFLECLCESICHSKDVEVWKWGGGPMLRALDFLNFLLQELLRKLNFLLFYVSTYLDKCLQ